MCLACRGKEIPTQWEHDPAISDRYGSTVAMYLASYGNIIPARWEHDQSL